VLKHLQTQITELDERIKEVRDSISRIEEVGISLNYTFEDEGEEEEEDEEEDNDSVQSAPF